jgi:DNA-3-methyladenine glycosylase I
MKKRCAWAQSELGIPYHDEEWGVPLHQDDRLFEFITLEGAQAGLSWETILRKRARYREVFDGFVIAKVARYNERKVETLLSDAGIVRNRAKIASTIGNARAALAVQREFGSLDAYLWSFVGGAPVINHWAHSRDLPATSGISDRMSRDLRARDFRFVGSRICYALMQACGLVNDHCTDCFRYRQLGGGRGSRKA